MIDVRIRPRSALTPEELQALLRWLERAFDEPPGSWRTEHWDDLGPGPHLMIERDGELLAHACLAWVPVDVGDERLLAGYVEDVATRADARGRGYGTALLQAARPLLEEEAQLGLLSTGSPGFYERLGWVRWSGPTSVQEPDGTETRTPEEDDGIMALFVARTPSSVSTDAPIRRPRRDPVEAW
jgi:aminoglycoside 2'-N-acetyltransferase I